MKNVLLILSLILMSAQSVAGSEKVEIQKVIKNYEKALNGNDTSTIIKLYSKKSVFMPQHAPAQVGIESIENAYKGVFKSIDLNVKFTIHDIEVFGNLAWVRTSSLGKTKILANGAIVKEGNNELFIFKKEKGNWKIYQYLFSTNQPRT